MKPRVVFVTVLVALLTVPPLAGQNLDAITSAQLHDYLAFVASDEMEGRATPSRGLNTTARFLALMLSRAGVKPGGGDGTYFQKIMLRSHQVEPSGCFVEFSERKLNYGSDFVSFFRSPSGTASGNLVFADIQSLLLDGDAIAADSTALVGKIVVLNEVPDVDKAITTAKMRGAVGAVLVVSELNQSQFARLQQTGAYVEAFEAGTSAEWTLPTIVVSRAIAEELFAGESVSLESALASGGGDKKPPLIAFASSKRLSMKVAKSTRREASQNVIGIVEGSDPKRKEEYVAVSAHYDHVGVGGSGIDGDALFNGADDDGSGTVATLSIAEAAARMAKPPKRSLMFIWHMGEERGLWGSRYYVSHPTVPLSQITALINIDMIGRSKTAGDTRPERRDLTEGHGVYVIGATLMSSDLGELCQRVNAQYLRLKYNTKYDNPRDRERFFTRSDHFSYALKGIPILFFFSGTHEDYHGPNDEAEKIDYLKMEKVTRTIFKTVWELAQMPKRPRVDKPIPDEFTR